MKKILNSPADYVDEMLVGLVAAHPEYYRLHGDSGKVVARAKAGAKGKVGIVTGGGSGISTCMYSVTIIHYSCLVLRSHLKRGLDGLPHHSVFLRLDLSHGPPGLLFRHDVGQGRAPIYCWS